MNKTFYKLFYGNRNTFPNHYTPTNTNYGFENLEINISYVGLLIKNVSYIRWHTKHTFWRFSGKKYGILGISSIPLLPRKESSMINLRGYLEFFEIGTKHKVCGSSNMCFCSQTLFHFYALFFLYKVGKSRQVVHLFKYTKLHLETLQCLSITHVLQQLLMPEIYRFRRLEN